MLKITDACSEVDIASVRKLMREYQAQVGIDLCFQGFEAEVSGLPGPYLLPAGRLLLATYNDAAIGCVAVRALSSTQAEMKRLFVRPEARGLGVGRALVTRVLDEARRAGYSEVVLDTLPTMGEAQQLYESFGFSDIPPYCANPVPGARYLARNLRTDSTVLPTRGQHGS